MRRLFVSMFVAVALSGCVAGTISPSDDDVTETPVVTDSTNVTPSVPSQPNEEDNSSTGGEVAPPTSNDVWQDDGELI